ncbi:claudin-1-like [Clavelina lepadiformis]|uniref:Claudin n=1 Tax=Clavelina lepadiformis TaxID=159417 RepID=A0ABP0F8M1_CLALP
MANSMLQVVGLILGIIGFICIMVTTFVPEWRRNDPTNEVIELIVRREGIWSRCIAYPTGLYQCDDFDRFFVGLPGPLQAARALACLSIAFSLIALVSAMFGMDCVNCLDNQRTKSRIAICAGVSWIIAGGCIGSAVSYYSWRVLSEYQRDTALNVDPSVTYIYGACLFVGWTALIVCFFGGLLTICGSRYAGDEYEDRVSYRPTPAYGRSSAERVSKPNYNMEYV